MDAALEVDVKQCHTARGIAASMAVVLPTAHPLAALCAYSVRLPSGCLILANRSTQASARLEPTANPWLLLHRNDLADFAERVSYVLDRGNDAKLRQIAEDSTKFVEAMDMDQAAASLKVELERCFECGRSVD